jgi:hypothetical protein
MKKHLTIAALFGLLVISGAFAHDMGPGPGMHDVDEHPLPGVLGNIGPKEGPCADLKLDSSQKSKLKDAFFKYKDEKIDLESAEQKAHLKYEEAKFANSADLKTVQDASQAWVASLAQVIQARESYRNDVDFGILKPEQRGVAHACMMSMHRGPEHGGPARE